MQTVTVVFDDVLHVHRKRATVGTQKRTLFSFTSELKYTPYITVPGWPRLEPGMRVKALLRQPGEWRSLVGWLDLKTGEITAPKPTPHLHRLLFTGGAFAIISSLIIRAARQSQDTHSALFVLASFFVSFAYIEYKAWRQAKVDLRALQVLASANEA